MRKRMICLLMLLTLLWGCSTPAAPVHTAPSTTEPPAVGITFQFPEDALLEVYTMQGSNKIPCIAAWEDTSSGIRTRFYPALEGSCCYTVSGDAYYRIQKQLLIPSGSCFTVNADPGKRTGGGCEPSQDAEIRQYTDQFMAAVSPADPGLWPQLSEAFITPWFTNRERGAHQATTHTEMMAFLESLDGTNDSLYLYTLGTSPLYGLDIPLLIYTQTDLSGASTWQEAAALLRDNGKLTVHYQAQIHGNEPAAGESALGLAKLLDGQLGQTLLDTMDIYIVPRLNVDGSEDFIRRSLALDLDLNRDMLHASSKEVQLHHALIQAFQPHIRMDAHEFTTSTDAQTAKHPDIMISTGHTMNNTPEFQAFSAKLAGLTFDTIRQNGLRPTYYSETVNDINANTGRVYAGNLGCISILLETRGIKYGTTAYPRRIAAQLIPTLELLRYAGENRTQIMALVENERAVIAQKGAVYDEADLLVLQTGKQEDAAFINNEPKYLMADGTELSVERVIPKAFTVAQRTRTRPTAYVIPAGESWSEAVLAVMERHGIAWELLPQGSQLPLQQYLVEQNAVTLSAEATTKFPKGAYVFPMNQHTGNILALLMEPDVDDVADYKGTLVQAGLITESEGTYPIYRYIHDLDPDGSIP